MSEKKRILVVDDEKNQREILETILSGEGYDVTTASSGEAAMKFVESRRFDLVLTDLKMTGMSGLDLLKELTNFDRSIIVILLTAVWIGGGMFLWRELGPLGARTLQVGFRGLRAQAELLGIADHYFYAVCCCAGLRAQENRTLPFA